MWALRFRPFASSDWMDIKPFAASDGCPQIAFDTELKKCADKNVLKKSDRAHSDVMCIAHRCWPCRCRSSPARSRSSRISRPVCLPLEHGARMRIEVNWRAARIMPQYMFFCLQKTFFIFVFLLCVFVFILFLWFHVLFYFYLCYV